MQIYLPHRRAQFRGTAVSKTGLVSFWKLDEASGTRSDAHGSNDLTDNNTVGQGTGNVYANCADMEKSNSEYLTVADNAGLRPNDFTFSAWVNLETTANGNYCVASKDDYSTNATREWLLQYESDGGSNRRFRFYTFYDTSGAWDDVATPFGETSASTWYLITVTMNSSQITIRVNDDTPNTLSVTSSPRNTSSTPSFALGTFFNGATSVSHFDGLIGPAMFWSRVLSDAEITALANKDDPFYDQF